MGVFDQNGGRLPPANTPIGQGAPQLGGYPPGVPQQAGPAQALAGPQVPASQITAPRLVDQNLVPPGAATPLPQTIGQRPYNPLNFGGMGRGAPTQDQLEAHRQQVASANLQGNPMNPAMAPRPMPPQAMGGMAPGNFDRGQLMQRLQGQLANGGRLPPPPPNMDPEVLRRGMQALGMDPTHVDRAMGGGNGPMLAQALMNRRTYG